MGARSSYQPNFVSQGAGFGGVGNFATSIGSNAGPEGEIAATGGTVTNEGGFRYHKFTSPGTFVVTGGIGSRVDVMMIGGGGGGGYDKGGGGAAGAMLANLNPVGDDPFGYGFQVNAAGTYPITIGAGGDGADTGPERGTAGGTTTFAAPWLPVTNAGGGGGGGSDSGPVGPGGNGPTNYGGSGGGGRGGGHPGGNAGTYSGGTPGNMNSYQSQGCYEQPGYPNQGGGGGGAAGSGPGDSGGTKAGRAGKKLPWIPVNFGFANNPDDPTAGYFAGGGPGGGGNTPVGTVGSIAGSGYGGYIPGNPNTPGNAASPAQANSGSGGGGGDAGAGPRVGGTGGPGVVIVRYVKV